MNFEKLSKRWRELLTDSGALDNKYVIKKVKDEEKYAYELFNASPVKPGSDPMYINARFSLIRMAAKVYAYHNSSYHKSKLLKTCITNELAALESSCYNAKTKPFANWWYWEIGIPLSINDIILLMDGEISEELVIKLTSAQRHFNDEIKLTGANRMWESRIFIGRAIILRDDCMLNKAIKGMEGVIKYTENGDGFYRDGSFIQHEKFAYTGGYGASLLAELSDMLYVLKDMQIKNTEMVYEWIWKSFAPFLYKGRCMDMVRGREISRVYTPSTATGHKITAAFIRLANDNPRLKSLIKYILEPSFYDDAECPDIIKALDIENDKSVTPYKPINWAAQFYNMDRAVVVRENYTAGLAYHSSRTANYESINGENTKAYHTGNGMLYIYNGDDDFGGNFWPTVHFSRLPGVTAIRDSCIKANECSDMAYAGGASAASELAASFILHPYDQELYAQKSYFFFEREIVCLGTGISGEGDVETTIINKRLHGRVYADGYEVRSGEIIAERIFAEGKKNGCGIGAVFFGKEITELLIETRTGKWSDITVTGTSGTLMESYATVIKNHGSNPKDESYAYILLPSTTKDEVDNYRTDVEIIANTPKVQAVKKGEIMMISFYEPGEVRGICASAPISLIIKNNRIFAADPTHDNQEVILNIEGKHIVLNMAGTNGKTFEAERTSVKNEI